MIGKIIQKPNTVIAVAIIASVISHFATGQLEVFARALGTVAWSAWSYDELAHGTNWFRKALGAIVLVGMVITLNARMT